ncbi:putative FAD dependent oxidoreductase [Neohortaea acidophila]|uniref:Putative FAD dependent oxidoreductase n=1 Tax=Neohortaea acidophila TaxID=245834 RepID=A0A6A6PXW6_9PEZI|nr:putative FAD dependent oxidoreductase [Neohortaea acidophila]KAF2485018.1 putative FAD dependent oxidoreductase [Neohortaea acidophila]
MENPKIDDTVPVLIIGAGPAGATLALHLARLNIKSLMISRHSGTANTPRAHIFNQRAMEVLRDAGLEPRLEEVASPAHHMQHTSWSNTLNGDEYGRMWSWGSKPSEKHRYEMASPCVMSDLPQSLLEPILVDEGIKHGVTVRFSTEFERLEDHGDYVLTLLRDRKTERRYWVRSQYLVGADGARSSVLNALEIPVDGKQLNNAFNVHIKADLTKYMVNRPGSLNWILNTDAPEWSAAGNFRMVRPWNEWVVSMHPASDQTFEPTMKQIDSRLRQMIGDDSVNIEILSSFRWTINDQVARSWQKGRVLCIGDAVHRHPPINGLGSNTCISDAFNLAWKLAYVLKGLAGSELLQTLTTERKPVGDAVVRRANDGMLAHRRLWALLGLTPHDRDQAVNLLKATTHEGREMRARLRKALEATDAELQALGIQMNQIYSNSAAVYAEQDDRAPDLNGFDLLKEVAISTYPGYHLPHFWVAANGQSPRTSVLDLCGHGHFTVLTGVGGECWKHAASELSQEVADLDMKAVSIGYDCDYMDCYHDWGRLSGVEEDGVVLVRPDHFVAWRFPTSSADATSLLRSAMLRVLCRAEK